MIVDEFIENPKPISGFSNPENHWPDYLALLHLLLIKHGEKKHHMMGFPPEAAENIITLSDKLELKWRLVCGTYAFDYQKQSVSIPQIVLDVLFNAKNGKAGKELIIAKDEDTLDKLDGSVFSNSNTGKILEYSECCIRWFDKNQSTGWEEVYEFIIKNSSGDASTHVEELVEMMYKYYESYNVEDSKKRIQKIKVDHVAESRNTMPFIFFQPCDVCIGPSSPSRKLNEKYANFAKENYPELYKKIIDEAKKDAKAFE
jgi:hypothetical protein|tara:strand:- start:117 stop:890 length:774 start_codon:yes stop_codon:yes gene_type:complete